MASILDSYSLKGKVAIVVGAGGGIGRAISEAYAEAGAAVGCLDFNEANARDTATAIVKVGGRAIALKLDVTSENETRTATDAVCAEFGRLDILVNCAATSDPSGTVVDYSLEDWNRVLAVNLSGCFLMSKAAIPQMVKHGSGSIIHIASQLGSVGAPERAVYCAVKGALINLARAMAVDHSKDGIRVNTLSPGAVETNRLVYRFGSLEEARQAIGGHHLLGRLAQPREIAAAAVFLASDASSFMTGSDLLVDGGYTAT
jgi:NAD(P)-dependent dehydrogenase (short-subunit alcohol dehydrogenase family)